MLDLDEISEGLPSFTVSPEHRLSTLFTPHPTGRTLIAVSIRMG